MKKVIGVQFNVYPPDIKEVAEEHIKAKKVKLHGYIKTNFNHGKITGYHWQLYKESNNNKKT